ncbi:MAG TPA: efflux RND transporter permease subunit [Gemmatimonadales bacterium]|nr:efflux RND transporter permease subunit [Gemmatimonadales bacterium]
MSLAAGALRRPVTTFATVLALVLLGAVSLGRMPVSLLPDVSLPVLTIRTTYEGAAATEVSRFIAEPLEEAVAATPGLVDVRSVSRNGESVMTLRFAWGTNMPATVLQVRERLDNARSRLPQSAERPTLLTSDPGERPIAVLGLTGPGDLRSIARTAKDVHARRLEQLTGVASVAVVGAPEDEIRVEVDPDKARSLGVTPGDVAQAVREANAAAPGGTVKRGQFRFALRALTEFQDVQEVARTPVGPARSGITLADIGSVSLTTADPLTLTRFEGAPAVGLVVYKDAGANTVSVTRDIYRTIGVLTREFPDVHIEVVAAQAEFVTDALSNLAQEIFVGGALSLLVILLFLRDWRGSLAIALIVPLSVFVALTILQFLDVTVNILSLGGLALGIGLLVDNAIVVAEGTGRYREQGVPPLEAAGRAASEVTGPLIAGTLTTILVFGPIVFVRGLSAALFRDLSLSVVVTLTASLVLALTLMPVMLAKGGRAVGRTGGRAVGRTGGKAVGRTGDRADGQAGGRGDGLERWGHAAAEWYERGMLWSLRRPGTVFGIAIAVTVLTVLVTLRLPREILPRVDEGIVVAQLSLPQGTAIEETTRQTARLEAAAKALGSSGIYSRVGLATDEEVLAGADPGTSATAQLLIPVPDGLDAGRFAQRLRDAVPDLAQGALALDLAGQSEFGSLIGREGRVVRVEVSAPRLDEARTWADTVRKRLEALPTLTDVRDAFSTTQPTIEVTLERARIAEHGLSVQRVADVLSGGLGGVESGEFRETDRRTPITVQFAGNANEDLAVALATPVNGVPVGQLVSVREMRAPVEVVRMNQRPVSVVEAVVERGGTARATGDVERALATLRPPAGLAWQISGADTEQRRTTRELTLVAVLSVALVFLVLAGEFASFTTPLLVMLTVPLAAAGGLIFLWLTGQSLNAVSLIGIVVMIGMADNEAVVKLDAIRRFREQGHPVDRAVLLGGRQRLRAIAMTSITTITGVLPLVFGWGSGGELYQPLAAGVIGGSVSALLVTFFLLPTAYAVVERRKERRLAQAAPTALPPVRLTAR